MWGTFPSRYTKHLVSNGGPDTSLRPSAPPPRRPECTTGTPLRICLCTVPVRQVVRSRVEAPRVWSTERLFDMFIGGGVW